MNVHVPQTSTEVAVVPEHPPTRTEVRVVSDPIAVLDTARFEHMQRIANVMAHSNLIPDSLCMAKNDQDKLEALPMAMVTANCFLVVNQAVRWSMDPFAVAQCVSVIHGKLTYEGKLIAAVLNAKLGVELEYEISGQGDTKKVVVTGTVNGKALLDSKGRPKAIEGTVGEWKTTASGSPWSARGGHDRMLRYRGAREWARVFAPALMLGVYSDDEMEDLTARQVRHVEEEPPAPPPVAQVTHQPSAPAPEPTKPVEQLVEEGQRDTAQVEWTDPPTEEQALEPPAPPHAKVEPAKAADDLDIPPMLRRTPEPKPQQPKPEAVDAEGWLRELNRNLATCEDLAALADVQREMQTPMKGRVAPADWARSQTLVMDAFHRINGDGEVGEGEA